MGKASDDLLARGRSVLFANYRPMPAVFQSGRGCTLIDVEGREVLDMAAGVAVCSVGHAHPKMAEAVAEQAAELVHVSNYVYNVRNIELAEVLVRTSKIARAFFCNSGAEANEAALKLARYHFYAKGQKHRSRVIAFENGFHGRTLGALSLTGTAKYREGFGELGHVSHVPYGDLAAVRAAMGAVESSDVCAIIVECVQGEGGVLPAPEGFLQGLRELADAHGVILIFDEVQTGIGRLGTWFGFQRAGVTPDVVTLAKGLGGGVPIGAMLTSAALADSLPPGTHGSTFGGNPLACRAALAVFEILQEEGLVAEDLAGSKVEEKGRLLEELFKALCARHPRVCAGSRGQGLLRGLLLQPEFLARDCLPLALEAGLLLTAAGERVLRFTPPLIVREEELREAVKRLESVVEALEAKLRAA